MNRYVKKPIAIEAVKWKGFNNDEIKDFAGDSVKIEVIREGDADRGIPPCIDCSIKTLEGVMTANVGDYIIKGVQRYEFLISSQRQYLRSQKERGAVVGRGRPIRMRSPSFPWDYTILTVTR